MTTLLKDIESNTRNQEMAKLEDWRMRDRIDQRRKGKESLIKRLANKLRRRRMR
jgi:hypothetical protein